MAVELATAYISLVPSFKGGLGALQKEAGQMGSAVSRSMADEVEKAGGSSGVLGKAFAGVAIAAGGVFAGAKLLGGFLREAQEAQTVAKQTAAVLTSTGNAAKVSAGDVDKLATSLSKKSGVDDEVIASGENVLLTFTKVANQAGKGNDIFNQGTSIALDMSKALGTDLQGSVIQVGKALNDPIKGISALSRVGVSFTEQQKDQIKALVASGDVLGAQKVILSELSTEFGGAAEASATSGDKLKVAWGNVQEQLGTMLLPVFEKVAGFMSDNLPKAADFVEGAIHKIVDVFKDIGPTIIGGLSTAWDWVQNVWSNIGPSILGALSAAWDWIQSVWPKVRDTVVGALSDVVSWVQSNWGNIRDILAGAFEGLQTGVKWVIDHQPILIGVLTAIGVGLAAVAVSYTIAGAAAVASGIAAAAAWLAAAAIPLAIGAAIAAVVAGFVYLYQNFDGFRHVVDSVVDGVVAAGQWLVQAWGKYADDIGRVLLAIGVVIGQIFMDIVGVVQTAIDTIATIISGGIEAWKAIWPGLQVFGTIISDVFKAVVDVITTAVGVIAGLIEGGIATFKVTWGAITWLFDFFRDYVYNPLIAYYGLLFDIAVGIVKTGVGLVKTAWSAIVAIYDFFRDSVYNPLATIVGQVKDTVVGAFTDAKNGALDVWNGIVAVYDTFKDNVFDPLWSAVTDIKNHVIDSFTLAKDGVAKAWDLLKGVVAAPINVVIGFYNDGIRGVWNAVISKIPGIGDLPAISPVRLNTGGPVPGTGNRDTVPAMLTPGEFVITKAAAAAWGPSVLRMLNRGPTGTADPAIFGYASGGPVRSVEETQAWMKAQAGKPYVFAAAGPDSFDCSGFTSALINFVLGGSGSGRRHSSGSVGGDPALQPGAGPPEGLTIGAKPPYMTNRSGDLVGHTAATVAGLNAEATPPAVLVGGGARGGLDGMFPEHYFMPGFGGLSEEDKGIVAALKSLLTLHLPDLGGPPIGDLLTKLFSDLPHTIYDFLVDKMPSMIYNAVKDAALGVFKALTPFADGGEVKHAGPILVGERSPEILWGSRGQYIESLDAGRGGGAVVRVDGNVYGDDHIRQVIREEASRLEWRTRATAA